MINADCGTKGLRNERVLLRGYPPVMVVNRPGGSFPLTHFFEKG
jgi:hypothetical protein